MNRIAKKQWMIAICVLCLLFSACGAGSAGGSASSAQADSSTQSAVSGQAESTTGAQDADDDTEEAEEAEDTEDAEESVPNPEDVARDDNVLIIYFSAGNLNDTDAVTGATPMTGTDSSTGLIAQYIQEETHGVLAQIMPLDDYPLDYNDCLTVAQDEKQSDARPGFVIDVDPEEYETIYIGYPVWWYQMPMIMNSFFEEFDFSGKTLIPFNTHEGSRDGGTWQSIAQYEPEANVLQGLAVRGGDAPDSRQTVIDWIASLQ